MTVKPMRQVNRWKQGQTRQESRTRGKLVKKRENLGEKVNLTNV